MSSPLDDESEGRKHIWSFCFGMILKKHLGQSLTDSEEFITDALIAIYQGEDPKHALKLIKKRGNKRKAHEHKYIDWAIAVELKNMHYGNPSRAIEEVSNETGISFDTIEKRYREYADFAKSWIYSVRDRGEFGLAFMIFKEQEEHGTLAEALASISAKTGIDTADLADIYVKQILEHE